MMIKQFFYFDALECLPADAETVLNSSLCEGVSN